MKLKKTITTIVSVVCACTILTGCTKVNDNLTAKDIQKSIEETGLVENMEETGTKGLKRYYGLNASDFGINSKNVSSRLPIRRLNRAFASFCEFINDTLRPLFLN